MHLSTYCMQLNAITELTAKSASVVWSQRRFIHGHAPDPMCSSTGVCLVFTLACL